jgi:perosamine synthetase
MNKQKIFKKMKIFKKINMPVSEYISRNGFYLPSGLGLKNQEIDRVIKTILKVVS